MKKQLVLMFVAVLFSISMVSAQGGNNFPRRTPEERVKAVMDKLADFKLDKAKSDQTDSVFINYYRAQQKMREDMMASGAMPDRDVMREKMQKLSDERDARLKTLFTDDQYKKWKDEIEPSLRPQRPNGQGKGQK